METNTSSDSLSGQNMVGRNASLGSSPSRSTKIRTRIWKQLRKLDRRCSQLYQCYMLYKTYKFQWDHTNYTNYIKTDQKRKEIRLKLKALWKN